MTIDQNIQEINRTMWSYGEYRHVADLLRPGAVELVDRLAPRRTPPTSTWPPATATSRCCPPGAAASSPGWT